MVYRYLMNASRVNRVCTTEQINAQFRLEDEIDAEA